MHGETPDAIKNHRLLKGVTIPRTGQTGILGTLTTKTLIICGDEDDACIEPSIYLKKHIATSGLDAAAGGFTLIGAIASVQDAISAGKKVVNMDQILGKDLSTDQPQVDGLSGNVVFVPTEIGTKPSS